VRLVVDRPFRDRIAVDDVGGPTHPANSPARSDLKERVAPSQYKAIRRRTTAEGGGRGAGAGAGSSEKSFGYQSLASRVSSSSTSPRTPARPPKAAPRRRFSRFASARR